MSYAIKVNKVAHIGNNVSHAKNRSKRTFMYNLHRATMTVDGEDKKILVPTNVLRTMKRNGLIKTFASRKTEK